jgi:hypothetical protein
MTGTELTTFGGEIRMTNIRTIIHNRRIEVPAPDELPDGTEVLMQLVPVGLEVTEQDDSPEGIAAWLQHYEALEPLMFTAQELADLEADRQMRKAWEKSQFHAHADMLAKQWQ